MKVVAAYLLARLGGKDDPTVEDLDKILGSVGIEADTSMVEMLLSAMNGKDLNEVLAAGKEKFASFGGSVAGISDVAVPAPSGGSISVPGASEAKKEEKEENIEEDDDFMMDLFG